MNESEILNLTRDYELTGQIPDALIPYFNQHGRWLGDRSSWRRGMFVIALTRMRNAVLPVSRRTARCRAGVRLLTSYVSKKRRPVLLLECEVAGSILAGVDAKISAPNLRVVGGHFHSRTTALVNLPQLRTVSGDFHLRASREIRAPRLQRIDGNMGITGFDFPALQEVGGRLSIHWGCRIKAPQLQSVGGTLHASAISSFEVPQLKVVGGDFVAASLTLVIAAPVLERIGGSLQADWTEVIVAPRLRSVGGSIHTAHADRFYNGRIKVSGEWHSHPMAKRLWEINEAVKQALYDPGIEL